MTWKPLSNELRSIGIAACGVDATRRRPLSPLGYDVSFTEVGGYASRPLAVARGSRSSTRVAAIDATELGQVADPSVGGFDHSHSMVPGGFEVMS